MSAVKYIINQRGERELFDASIISRDLSTLCTGLKVGINEIVDKLSKEICDGIGIDNIGQLVAEITAALTLQHPDYSRLAGRVELSYLYRSTETKFSTVMSCLYHLYSPINKKHTPIIREEIYNLVMKYASILDGAIQHSNDDLFDYFAIKTLKKTFLKKIGGNIVERPQHMLMRVALEINRDDIDGVLRTYELLSEHYCIHATPTIVNACTPYNQLSSCFLAPVKSDSIGGVYDTLKDCAVIGEHGGGIGLSVSDICSSKGSFGGGLVPLLRLFNNSIRYTSEFSPRKSGIAMYIEPWHTDVFEFLEARKNHGNENERARDVYTGLWIPSLFMERVRDDGHWTLMCPQTCPGLDSSYGVDFDSLYTRYEREGRGERIRARKLWFAILNSQIETGTPYMLYKDHCNEKSNQRNLGTIKCSNLCTEVVQYSSDEEVAVCNLASINLRRFVSGGGAAGVFDFEKLRVISGVVVRNLNLVIDRTQYPLVEAETSNKRHRPIGIGVQGLADVFQVMDVPFDSPEARQLNKHIFETIYYGACEASSGLAQRDGWYESYPGSPTSNGRLQYDLWGVTPSPMWNWGELKNKIRLTGLRNSLLLAPMPTATTAQVLGSSEGVDPLLSNVYNRRVDAGEFIIVNRQLVKKLSAIGLWTDEIRRMIVADRGSIQNIDIIPDRVKFVFKTAWEVSRRAVLDMAADRGAFVCQSQSTNIYMADPTFAKLSSLHFHSWAIGLKTGMYYLRTRPKADPVQVTAAKTTYRGATHEVCSSDGDLCSSCGA